MRKGKCGLLKGKVPSRQLWAWLLGSISAPLAIVAGKSAWLWVLSAGAICGAVCWGIYAVSEGAPCFPKWFCWLEIVWIAAAAGEMARWSGYCWEDGGSSPAVPVTLLLLAAWASWNGCDRASRVGSVLIWFLGLLYIVVLGAGARDLHWHWMEPIMDTSAAEPVFVFLIPVVAFMLPHGKSKFVRWSLPITVSFGVLVSLWTVGTLSWRGIQQSEFPFYQFSKSLRLFGVAERFESFVSVALTMSLFSLMSLFFSVVGYLTECLCPEKGRWGIAAGCALAVSSVLMGNGMESIWLSVFAVVFWGVLPLFVAICAKRKKSKKNEKSA